MTSAPTCSPSGSYQLSGRTVRRHPRLLEVADERVEVQVEARCWCGERATHNARLVDGAQVYDGELFVVDDPDDHVVSYELRCRRHWMAGESGDQSATGAVGSASDVAREAAHEVA
ncbi:MAG: hypothetical protein CM1200mP26_13940 [Acidimicrobiales bacterium]|nr:MAG: hypothetical protein CM1200mP26_13940 [Acidimicrobiales bacterium]